MNTSALIRKTVVAACLTTLVSLSGHLATDDSDARSGLKANPCAGRSLAVKGEYLGLFFIELNSAENTNLGTVLRK